MARAPARFEEASGQAVGRGVEDAEQLFAAGRLLLRFAGLLERGPLLVRLAQLGALGRRRHGCCRAVQGGEDGAGRQPVPKASPQRHRLWAQRMIKALEKQLVDRYV